MLKRKRQLQTMHKLTWQSKNLLLKVSKLLRKLKFQPQRQRKNKLQLLNKLLVKLLLQRLKVKRMVLQMPVQPLTPLLKQRRIRQILKQTALMLRRKAPRTNQLPLT
ncbi:hypothetical protein [Lactobacillus delbrueckii]|uniref:hypothetical protein n=1 Tax=Lactobacillus delbrueckii TaxID=1584 RepID=UPI001E302A23|nr:hypothetical protein [Lactobacillus delbrueckii]MCD5447005.1 hypothetical protein [Lactobacillus delbrueckii subsp. lactis]MCD5487204.1 hypothetical protein [Lactobacillus delbrueckii subsp. lactis]